MDTSEAGRRGGLKNSAKPGYFSELGKLSGKARREKILKLMTVGDLDNPVTLQSVKEALELTDKLDGRT